MGIYYSPPVSVSPRQAAASVTITSASAKYDTLPPAVVAELRKVAPPGAVVASETITATHFQVSLTLLPDVFLQQFVTQRVP